jgi:biopolymer transport protein ExbD
MAFGSNDQKDEIVSEINMTPLIDIMLVLLIIFMVTSSISFDSGMNIDLPKASQKQQSVEPAESVVVALDKAGQLFVQGKKVDKDILVSSIQKSLQESKTKTVIFQGDLKSTLASTVEIMELAKKAGAEQFALATENNAL